jgi:hypothetical protein
MTINDHADAGSTEASSASLQRLSRKSIHLPPITMSLHRWCGKTRTD